MVILKSLKKQFSQFVTPEFEVVDEVVMTRSFQQLDVTSQNDPPVKNAYSHGLEEIYALENVDPKTIRKLGEGELTSKSTKEVVLPPTKQYKVTPKRQIEMKLGSDHCSYMPSFLLDLPIHVLRVSAGARKAAKHHGLQYIRDLVEGNWDELILTKGLGQGHAEELKEALTGFIQGRELYGCQSVDFQSLVRGVVSENSLIKHYVNLEQYGLEGLIDLTPVMHLELKRASVETKAQWVEESVSELKAADCIKWIRSSLQQVVFTYVCPWLRNRNGFAYEYEVRDRLEQIAEQPDQFDKMRNFLSVIYGESESIVTDFLPTHDNYVVFKDGEEKKRFIQVEEKVLSYFYKPHLQYSLSELVLWLYREFAASWVEYNEHYIEQVINYSPSMKVRKNQHYKKIVMLA
jgi:hypothetical protein